MGYQYSVMALLVLSGASLASNYIIKTMGDAADAFKYTNITISNLYIPAGIPLRLLGLKNAVVTFEGTTTFGFKEWSGQMMTFKGDNVKVTGSPDHLIYGGGERWWDGTGIGGPKKPKFFEFRLNNSQIFGLRIKNTPMHAISINHSWNLTVSDIVVDSLEGDHNSARRTDGFNIYESQNVTIKNCKVFNQDDCIAVKSGSDLVFEDNFCTGGHGISVGSVGGRKSNIVERVLVRNNVIKNSFNGVRVKTVKNAVGRVTNVTFEDIALVNITGYGVTMIGNYILEHGLPGGDPTGGVPIRGLKLKNVHGTVNPKGSNYWVWVRNASDWTWETQVSGGTKISPCEGFPRGMDPVC